MSVLSQHVISSACCHLAQILAQTTHRNNLLLVLNTLILYYSHFIVAVSSHRAWTWSSDGQSAFKCDYKEETTLNNTNNRQLTSLKHVLLWCIQPIANKASAWLKNLPVYRQRHEFRGLQSFSKTQRRSFFEARWGEIWYIFLLLANSMKIPNQK